jgi:hypothetical protein
MQNQEVLWPGPSQLRGWFLCAPRKRHPPIGPASHRIGGKNHDIRRVACNSWITRAGTWFAVLPAPPDGAVVFSPKGRILSIS